MTRKEEALQAKEIVDEGTKLDPVQFKCLESNLKSINTYSISNYSKLSSIKEILGGISGIHLINCILSFITIFLLIAVVYLLAGIHEDEDETEIILIDYIEKTNDLKWNNQCKEFEYTKPMEDDIKAILESHGIKYSTTEDCDDC